MIYTIVVYILSTPLRNVPGASARTLVLSFGGLHCWRQKWIKDYDDCGLEENKGWLVYCALLLEI